MLKDLKDKKVITIQSEDEGNLLDVMFTFVVPLDFDEKAVEAHLKEFQNEHPDDYWLEHNYWLELSQSLRDKFNLKEIPFESFYIQD